MFEIMLMACVLLLPAYSVPPPDPAGAPLELRSAGEVAGVHLQLQLRSLAP